MVLATIGVGVVLADSSIVTLALPAIVREYGSGVGEAAWVLISYNLVLAAVALPAVRLARRIGTGVSWSAGLVLLAGASLVCALAPGLAVLVGGRCVQALGAAVVVAAAFEVLVHDLGRERAAVVWVAAGTFGAAVGPAIGGALTELLAWQWIFAAQVPLALLAGVARGLPRREAVAASVRERPAASVLVSLALLSAALTAALFLFVVLLIEGWGLLPLEAAAVVSIVPAAAVMTHRLGRHIGGSRARVCAGAIALAGGLAGLGLLPGAGVGWVIAPELLIGFGFGLAPVALSETALDGVGALDGRAAWTITARHAGVVLGLALLTPLFVADLSIQTTAAERAGSALLLDAKLPPATKILIGREIVKQIARSDGRLPDLTPAFTSVKSPVGQRPALARLEANLSDEVERGATAAFSRSFLAAALLALLALVPLWALRRGRPA